MTQLDDLERLCKSARRGEDPNDEDLGAVQRGLAKQLGLAAALGTIATSKVGSALTGTTSTAAVQLGATASVVGKASLASVVVAWLVGGAAIGGLTSWAVTSELSPQPAASVRPKPIAIPAVKPPSARLPPSAVYRDDPSESPAEHHPAAPTPRARAVAQPPIPTSSGRQEPPNSPSIVDEARGLAEVQRALRDGHADRALALLAQMDTQFGAGALGAERLAAQVLALCAAGSLEQGRALSDRFSALYPASPLMQRIRAACAR